MKQYNRYSRNCSFSLGEISFQFWITSASQMYFCSPNTSAARNPTDYPLQDRPVPSPESHCLAYSISSLVATWMGLCCRAISSARKHSILQRSLWKLRKYQAAELSYIHSHLPGGGRRKEGHISMVSHLAVCQPPASLTLSSPLASTQ